MHIPADRDVWVGDGDVLFLEYKYRGTDRNLAPFASSSLEKGKYSSKERGSPFLISLTAKLQHQCVHPKNKMSLAMRLT